MLQKQVGEFAGKIWAALNTNGAMTQKEIKKVTKLNEKKFYLAIGWLLRENKICVKEIEKELTISLK